MTIVPADAAGLRIANRTLDASRPIIVPLPSPLPYVVAATDPYVVNTTKRRPADKATGVAVADFALVAPHVELNDADLAFARWLSAEQLLNLLLPVVADGPGWMLSAARRGWLGVMLAWLEPIRPLLQPRCHLYLSSANRTGDPVAVTAAAADAAFTGDLVVIDGDDLRDPAVASGSATIVQVWPRRQLRVVRHGINDAGFGGDTHRFLHELGQRWDRGQAGQMSV